MINYDEKNRLLNFLQSGVYFGKLCMLSTFDVNTAYAALNICQGTHFLVGTEAKSNFFLVLGLCVSVLFHLSSSSFLSSVCRLEIKKYFDEASIYKSNCWLFFKCSGQKN